MGSLSLGHWILIAIIVLIFFGRANLGQVGRNIARGIRGFKEGLNEIEAETRNLDEIDHEKQARSQKEKDKEKDSQRKS